MGTIDADAHVLETERTWEYMSESERDFRPVVITASGPGSSINEYWMIDGRLQPKSQNVGQDTPKEAREMADIDRRIKHMDELGVSIQVLYPTVFLRPITNRPEVELALSRSYNRWLVDICERGGGRLRWVAVLPLLSMAEALAEARFAKERGACGIFIRGLEGERRLSDPHFFPLYEEASRLDLPICVHSANGSFTVHDFFAREPGFAKFKLAVVGAFHSIIFDGIPERFPTLKIAFIEVSSQWVPYAVHDLAKRFERLKRPIHQNMLRHNRIYVACQTDDDLGYVVQYAGEDNLVIGSDYGHADTATEIEALRKLKEKGEISPGIINKILDDNPQALYGL